MSVRTQAIDQFVYIEILTNKALQAWSRKHCCKAKIGGSV